jgi:hypothetical protein
MVIRVSVGAFVCLSAKTPCIYKSKEAIEVLVIKIPIWSHLLVLAGTALTGDPSIIRSSSRYNTYFGKTFLTKSSVSWIFHDLP